MIFGRRKRTINRILIVEDEPLVAFDNEHIIGDAGYEIVATVDTVEEAVSAITENEIDLVLADVNLSAGGTGLEVAHAAKARGIPLLFVTGACPVDAQALSIGCLAKPYPPLALLGAIEAVDATLAGRPVRKPPAGLTFFAH